jgi:hypothetical protein
MPAMTNADDPGSHVVGMVHGSYPENGDRGMGRRNASHAATLRGFAEAIPFHQLASPSVVLLACVTCYYISRTRFSVDIESSSVHVSYWMDRTTVKNAIVPASPTICQKSR